MGHAGMAVVAVRHLRIQGGSTASVATPQPPLRVVSPVRADTPLSPAPGEFRRVLGHFASGVTAITAPGGSGEPAAGFACQSFAALSLDPPLVVFMVARTSTTWPRIARAGVFCVNVLGAGQEELCRRLAVSGSHTADKFADVPYGPSPVTGSPLLRDVPAWADCTFHAVHTGGDHLIVVGRVAALGADEEAAGAGPLLFHRGAFTSCP